MPPRRNCCHRKHVSRDCGQNGAMGARWDGIIVFLMFPFGVWRVKPKPSRLRGMTARQSRRYFVQGRVQGVGFRYWTVGRARKLGLVGWVRNRRDGRVEVLAAGTQDSLDILAAALWAGPPVSEVLKVETGPVSADEAASLAEASGFEQAAISE